jgi:hypothetical protein
MTEIPQPKADQPLAENYNPAVAATLLSSRRSYAAMAETSGRDG